MELHRSVQATAKALAIIADQLKETAAQIADAGEAQANYRQMVAELAELRRELTNNGQPADAAADPLLSMNAICKRFGISRHSLAAERARRELPWIEVSPSRLMCRTSAAEAHFQPQKAD